jgi:HTH-type transcriptional regulator / antitoxin HipB
MIANCIELGSFVREIRKRLNLTQIDLALTAGTGTRFIVDLERGKETCEMGKVFCVLHSLGIGFSLSSPLDEKGS